jgi:hypothetical protein
MLRVHQCREVIPDRRLEFGLVVHGLDHAAVGFEAAHGGIESLRADAFARCLAPQVADAGVEIAGVSGCCRCQ